LFIIIEFTPFQAPLSRNIVEVLGKSMEMGRRLYPPCEIKEVGLHGWEKVSEPERTDEKKRFFQRQPGRGDGRFIGGRREKIRAFVRG